MQEVFYIFARNNKTHKFEKLYLLKDHKEANKYLKEVIKDKDYSLARIVITNGSKNSLERRLEFLNNYAKVMVYKQHKYIDGKKQSVTTYHREMSYPSVRHATLSPYELVNLWNKQNNFDVINFTGIINVMENVIKLVDIEENRID